MLASKVALSSSSFHTEVVVIGAGVIGLGITRALAKAGKEVILLEKEAAICTETSSRNSEVIHSEYIILNLLIKQNFAWEEENGCISIAMNVVFLIGSVENL